MKSIGEGERGFFCNLNRSVCASPPCGGSSYEKTQSGLRPLHVFVPPHFFAPVKMLRIFPHRAQKNVIYSRNVVRHAQDRYAM